MYCLCCRKNTNIKLDNYFSLKEYLKEKISKEHLLLLLSSSVYVQISYYSFKYWKKYIEEITKIDSPRIRTLSLNIDEQYNLDNIITIPTNRDIKHNIIPENEILNLTSDLDDREIFTPFSSIAKNYIDNLIYNCEIEKKPKILKIKREEYNYSCYLIIIKEIISQNIFFIPKIEVYTSNFNLEKNINDIINSYIENEKIINYIIENRLEDLNINIIGHLSTSLISYNFSKYLQTKFYKPKLIIYEPYLENIKEILIDKELNNDNSSIIIFSSNINITNFPKLLEKIIYIPKNEMINYNNSNNRKICINSIFDITIEENKKKNIRSYVHTLFKNIDEDLYLPKIDI